MPLLLKQYNFYIRLWHYLLPLFAFAIATYICLFLIGIERHPAVLDLKFYLAVLLFTCMVWGLTMERNQLCSTDELFREFTGIRKSISACSTTYTALLAVLFFYRQQNVSRIFFIVSSVTLFVLTVGTRVALRRPLRVTRNFRRSVRVVIAGTDQHARRIAARL